MAINTQAEELCSEVSCYPKTIERSGVQFYLVGKSDFTYLFMDIYSIGLYVDQPNLTGNVLDPQISKFLHFKYHRKIDKKRIVDGAVDTLKKNPNFIFTEYQKEIDQVSNYYSDVDRDDQYFLTYITNQGLTLSNPNQTFPTINNSKFAQYYLGIWLSEYPLSQRVRSQLLKLD